MQVELGPGVVDLLWRMGEAAVTVELTPRRLLVDRVGKVLSARADYA